MPLLPDTTKFRRSFELAVRSLWLHKLRSFLSVLGIIIGTAAVIALMAFGEGSMQDALEDIKRQGATNIIVLSVKPPEDSSASSGRRTFVATYGLTQEDFDRFAAVPSVIRRVPMRIFQQEIRRLRFAVTARVVATSPEYAEVHKLRMIAGRFLIEEDEHRRENVVVLGATVADTLFPFDDPIGQAIVVRSQQYRVIGVAAEQSSGGAGSVDPNLDIYLPMSTGQGRFGILIYQRSAGSRSAEKVELHQITLTLSDIDKVRPTGDLIRTLLEDHHDQQDWAVTVPLDRLEEAERAKDRFTRLLVLIASISLVVGGIGIMNIMLATVTERTREIGIRRALGAKRRDITVQFIVEAVVQTGVGGLAGVVVGLGTALLLPPLAEWIADTHLPAKVNVPSIFLALGVSLVVGILFGWYPARRAALLDPIEALRHV